MRNNPSIHVAPMVGVTTEHFNKLIRLISDKAVLYSEMTSTNSIRFGNALQRVNCVYDKQIIQLAGNNPNELGYCAEVAERFGYAGVNLNVGCPSNKIKKANYGAVLFKYPALVAECVHVMKNKCKIPISVKTRIGVDEVDNYLYLKNFVKMLLDVGCDEIVIHARKAYLKGLSPKANRNIPPLKYEIVSQLITDFPKAKFCLNGGINEISQVKKLLKDHNCLMLGRAIEKNPLILREIDSHIYGSPLNNLTRFEIFNSYSKYALAKKGSVSHIMLLKPLLGLYFNTRIAKQWNNEVVRCFNKKANFDLQRLQSLASDEGI
ncbi:MAG: tRNA dihydrouridine(20/20a) synthase DusA [Pseudomonadota bacterium]|nr:tRNA dihydrouridine(20/20a) synthase DusA [Pseudomonadota bacterium]